MTTIYKDGIENINIALSNLKAINADGEFLEIGYIPDNLIVYNLPWDGTDATKDFNLINDAFTLSPNPAGHNLSLNFDNLHSGTLELYGIDGKNRIKQNFDKVDLINLNISDLMPGIYFVKAFFEDGTAGVKKLIKH